MSIAAETAPLGNSNLGEAAPPQLQIPDLRIGDLVRVTFNDAEDEASYLEGIIFRVPSKEFIFTQKINQDGSKVFANVPLTPRYHLKDAQLFDGCESKSDTDYIFSHDSLPRNWETMAVISHTDVPINLTVQPALHIIR
jgi:hypothetical protein